MLTFHFILYLLAVAANWIWVRRAHGSGGRYESFKPSSYDLFTTLCPFWNIGSALTNWLCFPPRQTPEKAQEESERIQRVVDRIFRIK
jgi:hypothetical protein